MNLNIIFLFVFHSIGCMEIDNYLIENIVPDIHQSMSEDELLFYFGTKISGEIPRYELIKFPNALNVKKLRFFAFNRNYELNIKNNEKLLSPYFEWLIFENGYYKMDENDHDCHYIHTEEDLIVAFSFCKKYVNGLILRKDITLEILSLNKRLQEILKKDDEETISIIKPIFTDTEPSLFDEDNHALIKQTNPALKNFMELSAQEFQEAENAMNTKLTLETGIFFDEAAFKIFAPYFEYNLVDIKNMLLAYMNMVQALYYQPSLGTQLDIVIVKLEIFKTQPQDLPHYYGERSLLLDSFCDYNKKHNKDNDNGLSHWDIGLYISGLDFYSVDHGVRSGATMGLATVGGICNPKYSCVISEFGTTNEYGKPYPSSGFSSAYILAHEIGHSLGMHHDGNSNNCPKDGFIMSPSRGIYGETIWSPCSASVMSSLSQTAPCLLDTSPKRPDADDNKFSLKPGLIWGAKKQCEILLRDVNAYVMNSSENICENLMCQSTHRSGYYHAGPALDGTKCNENGWCLNGNCVKMEIKTKIKEIKGGWSEWKNEGCKSACIVKSKGYQKKIRTCTNPKPSNTDEGCNGLPEEVQLCKDEKICKKTKRISSTDYATYKCQEFSQLLSILEINGTGIQAPYEENRLWSACSVFCKRKNSDTFYSPRLDLNDLNVDPYFPDGTWCHTNGKQNYYCLQHQCLPESSFRSGKSINSADLNFLISQDANYNVNSVPEEIHRYFSLDMNGSPILKTIKNDPKSNTFPEWYVDVISE